MSEIIKTLESEIEILIGVLLVFALGVAVTEFFVEIFKQKLNWNRFKEILASFSPAIPAGIVEALTSAAILSFYLFVYAFIPWKWEPSWWSLLGALVVGDFIHY